MSKGRDHGGGLDAAIAHYGGARAGWIDLSTGINPVPYPVPDLPDEAWTALPDSAAQDALVAAARALWNVPAEAAVLAAPGASSLIARLPLLAPAASVDIPTPTYNEHAAAFAANGWELNHEGPRARVIVHPNNPTGQWYSASDLSAPFMVVDESFCDVEPARSLITQLPRPNTIILKSFGKFWGLAGLRLGFAIGDPELIARLAEMLGPWPVAGPALCVATKALADDTWADETRVRLAADTARLDGLMCPAGAALEGGTTLFRLYKVEDAARWQERLAEHHIWSRTFPYSPHFLRLGLPAPEGWARVARALK